MQEIKRGMAPEREATILQVFLRASGYALNPDGAFGQGTAGGAGHRQGLVLAVQAGRHHDLGRAGLLVGDADQPATPAGVRLRWAKRLSVLDWLRVSQPRALSVLTTPLSVAFEMPALSATSRVSGLSKIHTLHRTTNPVHDRSCGRRTVFVM